jgi:Reverse transcriptase (RNA-dependent DNA polymerase)
MFLEQPASFEVEGKEDWVMWLMKSIYGMKQASRVWNATFHAAMWEWNFTHLTCEWCIYRHSSPSGTLLFMVHVDDIITVASSPVENVQFLSLLCSKWDISAISSAKFTLGISIA